jgi:hypothetical protein
MSPEISARSIARGASHSESVNLAQLIWNNVNLCFFILHVSYRNRGLDSALFHTNSGAIAYLRVERYAIHSRHAMMLRALKTRYFTLFGAIRYSA